MPETRWTIVTRGRRLRFGTATGLLSTGALVVAFGLGAVLTYREIGVARSAAWTGSSAALAAEDLDRDLDRLLAIERAARLATDQAAFAADRRDFDGVADDAEATAATLGLSPSGHALTVADGGGPLAERASEAVDRLRADMPRSVASIRPPAEDDGKTIGAAISAATSIEKDGMGRYVRARRQAHHLERGLFVLLLAEVPCFLVLAATLSVRGRRERMHVEGAMHTEAPEGPTDLLGVIASLPDGIAIFAPDGRLAFRNERLLAEAGLPPSAVEPGTAIEAFLQAFLDRVPAALSDAPRVAGAPVVASVRTGGRALDVTRSLLPGGGHMIAVSDVGDREEHDALARRAQRLGVMERLTDGIAHDFNNLLQSLSAHLELARRLGAGTPSFAPVRLDALSDEIDRGARLAGHLRAFAPRHDWHQATFDAGPLLRDMTVLLRKTLGGRRRITCAIAPGLWPVLADRSQFENAVLNAALAVRDEMPRGGALRIDADNHEEDGRDVVRLVVAGTVADDHAGGKTIVATGPVDPGLGADQQAGLALVDVFARTSGGRTVVSVIPGLAMEVAILLPRAADGPASPVLSGGDPVREGRGELVLLVEDDPSVLEAARSALEFLCYEVRVACDADEAWTLLSGGLRPDILFSDVMMPGRMDVAELVLRLRGLRPDIPILLNTGYVDAPVLQDVRFDARTVLLPKPWRLATLSHLVRGLLDATRTAQTGASVPI